MKKIKPTNSYDDNQAIIKSLEIEAERRAKQIIDLRDKNQTLRNAAERVRSVLNDEGKEVLTKKQMEGILYQAITQAKWGK